MENYTKAAGKSGFLEAARLPKSMIQAVDDGEMQSSAARQSRRSAAKSLRGARAHECRVDTPVDASSSGLSRALNTVGRTLAR
jgi:hypothetical protein